LAAVSRQRHPIGMGSTGAMERVVLGAGQRHGDDDVAVGLAALITPLAIAVMGRSSCGGSAIAHGASLLPAPARPNEIIAPPRAPTSRCRRPRR